jgi:hypothetical protein
VTADVTGLLDALDAAHAAATPGPWQYDPESPGEVWDGDDRWPGVIATATEGADAAAIVAEHNASPRLVAALRAVLALADEIDEDAARQAPAAGLSAEDYARSWRADAPNRIRSAVVAALGVETTEAGQ